ncbi:MAG: CBS domain-containing protein [Labilithrix sp.]|nr:CBS domain-containing protein [Labilithrix sp.]
MAGRTKDTPRDATTASPEPPVETAHRPSRVADIMTRDVAACSSDDTLERAAQLMWDRACGSVPVVDELRRPIAMLTDRDVCMAAYTQGKPLAGMAVASAMSKRLFLARKDETLESAERTMRRHCLRRLPVVDRHGALVGLLSIADIATNGRLGPTLGRDGLSANAIAATVAALHHGARPASG